MFLRQQKARDWGSKHWAPTPDCSSLAIWTLILPYGTSLGRFKPRGGTILTSVLGRRFLFHFRLPGEAQKIDRMMNAFAVQYYNQNKDYVFRSAGASHSTDSMKKRSSSTEDSFIHKHNQPTTDAAHIMAFSVMMLNTDAHNAQIKKKMTEEEFLRNNRLINDGADLDPEFLSNIYQRIVNSEIKMEKESFPDSLKMGWVWARGTLIRDFHCLISEPWAGDRG